MSTHKIDFDTEFNAWARTLPEFLLDLDQAQLVWEDLMKLGFHTEGIKAVYKIFIDHHFFDEEVTS